MDSTSPTPASIVGSTSDFAVPLLTGPLMLVERFLRPMPKPGFAAEEGRTRHCVDDPGDWHGSAESTAARWGYPG